MITECRVLSVEYLNQYTCKVLLKPSDKIGFKAGQYIQIITTDLNKRPFSIASSPSDQYIELHIGSSAKNLFSNDVLELLRKAMQNNNTVRVELPHGKAWYRKQSQRPLLLIAGGTGYSYICSILNDYMEADEQRSIYLYWGVRKYDDLYYHDELSQLSVDYQQLTYIPVIENAPDSWLGNKGLLMDAVYNDFEALNEFDIYLCGQFEMVRMAHRFMIEHKDADPHRIYADAVMV